MKARFTKHTLQFTFEAGTSRGVLTEKTSWFIILEENEKTGIGECSPIWGLSPEIESGFESKIIEVCDTINRKNSFDEDLLSAFPSIQFGLETALHSIQAENTFSLYPSSFTSHQKGIEINGLIWMGEIAFMKKQIAQKLKDNYRCIKLKIGANNFADELNLLKKIRSEFKENELTIRLDANGAFKATEALEKLKYLSDFYIHSIEQPIKEKQHESMTMLCSHSPIDIALDEELIGVKDKENLLQQIKPQYIILKPSLLGGTNNCNKWIEIAKKNNVAFWATSMLESNIGLNCIAQWAHNLELNIPQGLGTGQLYTNNIDSALYICNAKLYYDPEKKWDTSLFKI